jgi:thiamine-monophosphate kinase
VLPETEFIKNLIKGINPDHSSALLKGIGDDCAVLRQSRARATLVTVDSLVRAVHFDLAWHPPYLLGRKAAAVNISDIAAMGGTPCFALLSIAAPADCQQKFLDEFMAGFLALLAEFDVQLIGGDTVSSRELMFSITLIGEMAEEEIIYRSGAQIGDLVWVSGFLGQAGMGLELCQNYPGHKKSWPKLIAAHLDPYPQVKLGRILAASRLVTAMLDISDGIATDLAHICASSSVGAEINATSLPISPALKEAAAQLDLDPLQPVLQGGEDYQLLFTSPAAERNSLQQLVKQQTGLEIYCIGEIVGKKGVRLLTSDGCLNDITFQGYEHNPATISKRHR